MDNRLFAAVKPTTLATGSVLGATTLTPSVIKDREDNSIGTMATYFGTKAYGVISPGKDREEHFTFTGISAGVLTGVSHITMVAPYTETSGLNEAHSAGEVIVLMTNAPGFYNDFLNKQNDETIAGTYTFPETALPRSSASHSYIAGEEEFFATKRYADGLALAGAPDANTTTKGIVEEATQAETAAGTAVGATSARLFTNPSTLAAHIQSGAWLSGSTAGTASAITATLTPTLTALSHNMIITLHVTTANNAACTLNVDGLGAKAVYKYAGGTAVAVEADDMKANYHHVFLYDTNATVWLLVNPANGTLTATVQTEVQNFFAATDITGAEAETLSSGATSNADTLHTHSGLITSFVSEFLVNSSNASDIVRSSGYSDATEDQIAVAVQQSTTDVAYLLNFKVSADVGAAPYLNNKPTSTLPNTSTAATTDPLTIGSDVWVSESTGTEIRKNGTAVTISGTNRFGPLGHNSTDSQLLVLYSTTKIAKFTGITGTTITNAVDDVTLDTAVTQIGFAFDDTNNQYVCVDRTANILRKFNSAGVTIETVAYTIDDGSSTVVGVCLIKDRYYLVKTIAFGFTASAVAPTAVTVSFIPTNMKR